MHKTYFMALLLISESVYSSEKSEGGLIDSYEFKPLLLDANDESGSVLGIQYAMDKRWKPCSVKDDNKPADNGDEFDSFSDINSDFGESTCFISAKLAGIWTNDEKNNPESFSTFSVDVGWIWNTPDDIETEDKSEESDYDLSLQFALEGDQNFENTQEVIALQGGLMFGDSTDWYIGIIASLDEVDSSENEKRMSLTDKDKFDRLSVEFHFQYPLKYSRGNKYSPKALSFNYRYFSEINAPGEIKDADLDVFQFGAVRIKFENGIFMGYANGKLPFDFDTKSVLEIGFTQNLF